jgi:hypothetical protein
VISGFWETSIEFGSFKESVEELVWRLGNFELTSCSIEISFKLASSSENESIFKVVPTGSTVVIGKTTKVDVRAVIVVNGVVFDSVVVDGVVVDGVVVNLVFEVIDVVSGTVLVGIGVVLIVVILSVVVSTGLDVVSSNFFCKQGNLFNSSTRLSLRSIQSPLRLMPESYSSIFCLSPPS